MYSSLGPDELIYIGMIELAYVGYVYQSFEHILSFCKYNTRVRLESQEGSKLNFKSIQWILAPVWLYLLKVSISTLQKTPIDQIWYWLNVT